MPTDPITQACINYMLYLRKGGQRVPLPENNQVRDRQRKLHPSSLGPGLCDRRAVYHVMADVGEIEPDIPESMEEQLGHNIGYIFQDWIAEALQHDGCLSDLEIKVENDNWTGRADLLLATDMFNLRRHDLPRPWFHLDPDFWLVDVKTVKGYGLYDRYPKEYHIAQLEKYQTLLGLHAQPILYYVTRVDFQATAFTWEWTDDGVCLVYDWDKFNPVKRFRNLDDEIAASEYTQVNWLQNGVLPDRCGDSPTEHPFMCASYNKYGENKGLYSVNCQYFAQCWEHGLPTGLVFAKGDYDDLPF